MEDFSKYKIKDYKYWTIFIHQNQGYLGRCIIWCKRKNALDLTDATLEERKEFFLILGNLKRAVTKVFQPDWFNYSFLGNETRHLHTHFIPRYASIKTFEGIKFKDELFGHNYKTNYDFITPETILEKIRLLIYNALEEKSKNKFMKNLK